MLAMLLENLGDAITELNALLEQGNAAEKWLQPPWRKKLITTAKRVTANGKALKRACNTPDLAQLAQASQCAILSGEKYVQAMEAWIARDQEWFRPWIEAVGAMAMGSELMITLGTKLQAEERGLEVAQSKLSEN